MHVAWVLVLLGRETYKVGNTPSFFGRRKRDGGLDNVERGKLSDFLFLEQLSNVIRVYEWRVSFSDSCNTTDKYRGHGRASLAASLMSAAVLSNLSQIFW